VTKTKKSKALCLFCVRTGNTIVARVFFHLTIEVSKGSTLRQNKYNNGAYN